MGNNEDDSEWHNPNAEGYVLSPGQKRVRFSFSEPVFHIPPYINEGFEDDEDSDDSQGPTEEEISRFKQVRARRRDSIYPNMENDKRIIIEPETENDVLQIQLRRQPEDDESDSSPIKKKSDPFENIDLEEEPSTPWAELSSREKAFKIGNAVGKTIAILALLYFFVCSLDLLSKGFRLVGGKTAGEIFKQSEILQNPVVGVMIGVMTTVLVQSSSTSTSIIVGMVAAGFMDVKLAIPLIMGANVGTSITSTIVSFMQAIDKEQFRRAFAGATILDMFNWLTVVVLLIVEVLTGYLYHVSNYLVDLLVPDSDAMGEVKLLSALTEPFVNLIIQLDESVLDCWASLNCTDRADDSLIKQKCSTNTATIDISERIFDSQGKLLSTKSDVAIHSTEIPCANEFIFAGTSMSDGLVGGIIIFCSLVVLCTCLILIVKVLSSVLRGHVSVVIKKVLNADIPYVPWITGYIAIFMGAIMTFLVQSSSVFTSALTPLVGLGVISLKRVYPLTLGANIGTTTTAVLASFAVDSKSFRPSMQIALCHLLFNLTGILLFYPVPYFRFPIQMAKFLGNCTAEYRWFAVLYMISMFAVVPAVFIGLSIAGSIYIIVLVSILGVLFAFILVVKLLQNKFPKVLPPILRNWKWLPEPLRSLKPYDDLFSKLPCCAKCRMDTTSQDNDEEANAEKGKAENGRDNFDHYSSKSSKEAELNKRNSRISTVSSQLGRIITDPSSNGRVATIDNSANSVIGNYPSTGSNGHISNNEFSNHNGTSAAERENNSTSHAGDNNYNSNNANGSNPTGGVESINGEIGSDNEGYRGSSESVIL